MINTMFRLTFLGTSSGMPTKSRNVSGLAVECLTRGLSKAAPWILVDCGEGTQQQLLKSALKPSDLMVICITHTHGDHCYGLAGLLSSLGLQGRKQPLTLIAPRAIHKLLDVYQQVSDFYLSYELKFIAIEDILATGYQMMLGSFCLAIDISVLSHRCASYAFGFELSGERHRLDVARLQTLGIPVQEWRKSAKLDPSLMIKEVLPKVRVVVAGDNDTPSLLKQTALQAVALVHEATYTQAIKDRVLAKMGTAFDPKHSSAKEVAEFAEVINLPVLILTHFSARFNTFEDINNPKPNMAHIRHEVSAYYHGECVLAEDFMQIVVDGAGVVY